MKPKAHKFLMLTLFTLILATLSLAQEYELYDGDTINRIDENNLKQGRWVFFGSMKNDPKYRDDQIVEEGQYKNNRKDGVWDKHFANDQLESKITFKSNRPNGEYKIYYNNGQLQEQGVWKNNRNVGEFKRFHKNGNAQQEFVFNNTGKRDGVQKYYHENGQLMIEGEIKEGKEIGEFKEYHANGDIKSIKVYDEAGKINEEKSKFQIEPISAKVEIKDDDEELKMAPEVSDDEHVNEAKKAKSPFNGNGDHTLYNKNRQISQKGLFKKYRLINGLYYHYDEDGILTTIERYMNGKYVGDVPIEQEKK